jgi:hypothetical protein
MDERIRDLVSEELTFEYFEERRKAGWIPVAVEWLKPSEILQSKSGTQPFDPPYGFRIASDGQHLETNPDELNVLYVMLEEIVRDRRFTQIADELNNRRLRSRSGRKWTPSAVFELFPALIEAGPLLTKSEEWIRRRPSAVHSAQA